MKEGQSIYIPNFFAHGYECLSKNATILYHLDNYRDVKHEAGLPFNDKDLKIKSPYNTYLNQGLPPGPINSPGRKSLYAALYPNDNEYLYFVAKGDGYHTFSKNERDHEKAKKNFQKIRRKVQRKKAGL